MSRVLPLPEVNYLRECFDYNEGTGVLTWGKRPLRHFRNAQACKTWNTRCAGTVAGTTKTNGSGYFRVEVTLCGHAYGVARIIWKLKTGEDPGSLQVDHRNGKSTDNSWGNLRLVTGEVSQRNRKTNRNNTSGVKGVYWHNPAGKWAAMIRAFGKQIHLGRFADKKDAIQARRDAEDRYGYHRR